MLRRLLLLKLTSYLILSPALAAAPVQTAPILRTPTVHRQVTALYIRALVTFMTDDGTEYAFTFDVNGQVSDIQSSYEHDRTVVTISTSTVGVVHTHPRGCSPRPSEQDITVARDAGIDNYVLSEYALWVAHLDGRVEKVGNVTLKRGDLLINAFRRRKVAPTGRA